MLSCVCVPVPVPVPVSVIVHVWTIRHTAVVEVLGAMDRAIESHDWPTVLALVDAGNWRVDYASLVSGNTALMSAAAAGDHPAVADLLRRLCMLDVAHEPPTPLPTPQAGEDTDAPPATAAASPLEVADAAAGSPRPRQAASPTPAHTSVGATALLFAAQNGHESVALTLVEAGADVGATNSDGKSVLYYAALQRQTALVERLLEAGAEISAKIRCTPLLAAVEGGDVELAKCILQEGVRTRAVCVWAWAWVGMRGRLAD